MGNLVDGLLARDHDPYAAGAARTQLLHERLQVEHEVDVGADVLAHLVHHKEQAERAAGRLGATLVHVLADVFHEGVDAELSGLGAVEPAGGRLLAHHARGGKRGDDVVLVEVETVARLKPVLAGQALVFGAELVAFALEVHGLLQAHEAQVFAVVAQVLIEHAGKHLEDCRLVLVGRALVVDVEKDRLARHTRAAPGTLGHEGVVELAVEVVDGVLAGNLAVGQQVREHLEEVRLTRAKEARDPYANLVGGSVDGRIVALEQRGEVLAQLARNNVLLQLGADGSVVVLGDLDHAVDGAVDVFLEHVLNAHGKPPG